MKKVLFIGYVWVEPNSSAAGSRMLQLIRFFKKYSYEITFASPAQKSEKAIDLSALGVNEVSIELNNSSFDDFISELAPTVVVFDRFMMEEQFGWRVAEKCPNALRILDTEDLHFLRKTRHKLLKKKLPFSEEALLQSEDAKREIAAILRCDLSLIISTYEMELLKRLFKVGENLLMHLPFLLEKIEEEQVKEWLAFSERKDFVFIGNFFHQPNIDAVLQLKQLWKKLRKKLPTAKLYIYGAYVTQQIQQLHKPEEGFIVKGFVENASSVVKKARVVLAPIRFGAGIKGKLTEAMICGTPSITTIIGAEGMHNGYAWNGFVVTDMDEFIKKAIALYNNEETWNTSQINGLQIINELYNREELETQFATVIEDHLKNKDQYRNQNFIGRLLQHQTLQATKYMSKWIEEKNKA